MIWLTITLLWVGITTWLYWRERQTATTVSVGGLSFKDLLAGGLLFGLTIGFFWRTVRGDVYQPADGGDLVSFLFPTYRFAAAQLQQGILPLWNPTLYGGASFIGDIQAGFLYPPNLVLFYLWPDFEYTVMQWLVVGHLYWAGLGMYLFLRTLGHGAEKQGEDDAAANLERWPFPRLSRSAALFGALAFQYCDPLLLHFGNLNLIAVLSWLPWILAAYRQALAWRSLRWAGVAGFLFALANFAGHAQSTFYIALVLALYTVAHWALAFDNWRTTQQPPQVTPRIALDECLRNTLLKVIGIIQFPLLTATLTTLMSAPILLPVFELARLTERNSLTYQDTVAFSLAPTQLIGLITPAFFGRGPALHWSLWSRVETPYAGVATLILAATALLLVNANVRRHLWTWVWVAVVGLTTAFGIYAIAHGWLTFVLPFFDQFRAPARALVLWTFGLAVLAAFGVDALQRQVRSAVVKSNGNRLASAGEVVLHQLLRWGGLGLAGIAVPLAYFALLLTQENETAFLRASIAALALTLATGFWLAVWALIGMAQAQWVRASTLGYLLVGLLFFDLSATGAYTDISPIDPTMSYAHEAMVEFLRNEPDVGRIDTLTDIAGVWQPDSAALLGLEDVGGIANPLMLNHWRLLWEGLEGRQGKLYDMLHVTHVVVRDGTPLPEGKFVPVFDAPGELALYRNLTAQPRAWLVHDVQTATTAKDALAILQSGEFDPTRQAVIHDLEQGQLPALASVNTPAVNIPATSAESVQITQRSNNQLALAVEASTPALLVFSEVWYPGWRATVNTESTAILRANVALRAIPIPAGTSTVTLRFAPNSWRTGLLLAIAGWVLLIAVFFFEKKRGQ